VGREDSYLGRDTFAGVDQVTTYPGQRLGLPEKGSGSVASWPMRFFALVIDWFAARLVAGLILGAEVWTSNGPEQFAVFGTFIVEAALLTALVGGSFGQLLLRIAVVRLDRQPVNILQGVLRSALICLVVPPLVFNRDSRGLHDLAVGTVVVRR
jgi:uncharacterized RDD family membrane protein YckC